MSRRSQLPFARTPLPLKTPKASSLDEMLALAVRHHQVGRHNDAEALYRKILIVAPKLASVHGNLGVLLRSVGRFEESIASYRQSLAIDPHQAGIWANMGRALREMGNGMGAARAFMNALALDPRQPEFASMLSNVQREQGLLNEAVRASTQATLLRPDHLGALCNLGSALKDIGAADAAIRCYHRSLSLEPSQADVLANLATVLKDRGLPSTAVTVYQRSLALQPQRTETYVGLANALRDMGDLDGSLDVSDEVLALRPDFVEAHQNRLMTLMYHSEWSAYQIAEAHERFDAQHTLPLAAAFKPHRNVPDPDRPLVIGYVSGDFRQHVTSCFFEPLLNAHNRSQFRIVAYSETVALDNVTGRLRERFDAWRPTVGQSDVAVAEMIRADGIDILVDLAGHSARNRLLVFAAKPAPVQVTWLGYPGTTGLCSIDYRLVDPITDPIGTADDLATEILARLPRGFLCYQPPQESPAVTDPGGGPVTFGSFNNLCKVSSQVFALWTAILHRVPDSRLLLKCRQLADPYLCEAVLQRFAWHGVSADRIDLRPWTREYEGHLALYGAVDVALDPFPYNGTTTTCEALWMGVPVVTLAGDRHAGRVGASLLTRVGLPELVAESAAAYVDRAAELAADRARRVALRRSLRKRMSASPLCDAPAFARQIETAYRAMWRLWCAGGS